MKNYSNIAIVASFFGLWMDSFLSTTFQVISGFFLIFTFGILHGANDVLLIKNINAVKSPRSWLTILTYYIVIVLTGVLLFYWIPQIALLLFIMVSAYHFGEQQWQNLKSTFPQGLLILFQFLYGIVVLLLLFVFHTIQVQNIIFKIAKLTVPLPYFITGLQIAGVLFLSLCGYAYWKTEKIRSKLLLECFNLILFTIIFKSSSLIWGFAIYFVIWHSIPSIIDQIKFLNGTFSIPYFITYCKDAGIYWLISIMGISMIYYLCKEEEQLFNALFFSFLAAITFPHAAVITTMFHGHKEN